MSRAHGDGCLCPRCNHTDPHCAACDRKEEKIEELRTELRELRESAWFTAQLGNDQFNGCVARGMGNDVLREMVRELRAELAKK